MKKGEEEEEDDSFHGFSITCCLHNHMMDQSVGHVVVTHYQCTILRNKKVSLGFDFHPVLLLILLITLVDKGC